MSSLYSLEIISLHPDSSNKSFKKHKLEGINTIGVWKDEPFLIHFKNHSWQKVSLKLTVDGLDLLSGELATTEPTENMWIVDGYGTLEIKAWKEDNHGGAQLVFTSADNSVALHIHGDLNNRGIIAAAVYIEGHIEPIKVNENHYYHWQYVPLYPVPYYPAPFCPSAYPHVPLYPVPYYPAPFCPSAYPLSPFWYETTSGSTLTIDPNSTWTGTTTTINGISSTVCSTATIGSTTGESINTAYFSQNVAVGAGDYVEQEVSYAPGLIKPILSEVIRVRYLWADELKEKLAYVEPKPHPTGFPADKSKGINLGSTPRIKTNKSQKLERTFSRF